MLRIIFLTSFFTIFCVPATQADGLFGGAIKDLGRATGIGELEDLGDELDRRHEDLGNPLDVPGRVLRESVVETAGPALAQAIRHSRDDARRAGVNPIPIQIRRALRHCFNDSFLSGIRYRVGQGHELSVQANSIRFGDATAVALIDTIIFRNRSDADRNIWLWAHEVTHIDQYESWGLTDFAKRYVRDHRSVEREADQYADKCVAAVRSASPPQRNNIPRPVPPRAQNPFPRPAKYCATNFGSCAMVMPVPVGSTCYCPTFNGPVWGQAR